MWSLVPVPVSQQLAKPSPRRTRFFNPKSELSHLHPHNHTHSRTHTHQHPSCAKYAQFSSPNNSRPKVAPVLNYKLSTHTLPPCFLILLGEKLQKMVPKLSFPLVPGREKLVCGNSFPPQKEGKRGRSLGKVKGMFSRKFWLACIMGLMELLVHLKLFCFVF